MSNFIIRIQWDNAIEYVPLDVTDFLPSGATIETREYRPGESRTIDLRASVVSFTLEGRRANVRLRYSEGANRALAGEAIAWGDSDISIDVEECTALATWYDDGAYPELNKTCPCTVVKGSVVEELIYHSVLRISRPEQDRLRTHLQELDGACALSGETTKTALDVAHIVPVAVNGGHGPDNAVLLRADLHRLFDAGLLRIQLTGEVVFHPSVSGSYQRESHKFRLPQSILNRIKRSLGSPLAIRSNS